MSRRLLIITLLLCSSYPAGAATRRRSVSPAFPPCAMIAGSAAVTFSRDEGRTLAPTAERLSGIGYTYGLAALDESGTFLAWHKSDLLLSTDNGCSWRAIATSTEWDFPPTLTAAKGGRAYIWSDNRRFLMRYDWRGVVKLKDPAAFVGLGVDPNNPDHLRAGSDDGVVWESRDAGETWDPIGSVRTDPSPVIFYRFVFSKTDLDHIVAGTSVSGAYVSRDGGRTWAKSTGLGAGGVNAFNFAISPVDDGVVWAMGIDLLESDANVASRGRHIYRSTDGGSTYVPVVDESIEVKLTNGPVMAAHPTDPNVVHFVFGTYFQGYGTDVYRYDAVSRTLTIGHNDANDINSIAFSPSDPKVMYFGLEVEGGIR